MMSFREDRVTEPSRPVMLTPIEEVEPASGDLVTFGNPTNPLEVNVSYMTHRLRKILIEFIPPSGVIFGGFPRRLLSTSAEMAKYKLGHAHGDMVPRSAVIDPDVDVDIFFPSVSDRKGYMDLLERHFTVHGRLTPSYSRSIDVIRLKVFPKFYLGGPKIECYLDLVTGPIPVVDFSVNTFALRRDPTSDVFKLEIFEPFIVSHNILSLANQVNKSFNEVMNHQTRMVLLSPADFFLDREQDDEEFHEYIRRFLYRLRKMINDGWTVVNSPFPECRVTETDLVLPCGHPVRTEDSLFFYDDPYGVLYDCPDCPNRFRNKILSYTGK
jgi:hypothetical protein